MRPRREKPQLGGERVGHLVDRFSHLEKLSCMNVLRFGLRARLALVACLTVAAVYRPTAAADPTPALVAAPAPGVAYDEIARVVPPGSTPPPVGSFADDAAVIAALPPLVVPKARDVNFTAMTLLASIPGIASQWAAMAAGRAAIKVVADDWKRQNDEFANGRAARQRTGVLARFAYYRGWSRFEFFPGYATIDKPEQGVTITLDSANKTYTSVRTGPIETFTVTTASGTGSVTLDGTATVEAMPALRIGGVSARGYRTTGWISVTRASYACAAGRHHVSETEYVSDFADVRYDAVEDAANAQPLVGACTLGSSVSHREPGRLVLYRAVIVDDGSPAAFGTALERGNVRALGEQDNAMFQPPPDFTEKP
jgi:hypothetical protein